MLNVDEKNFPSRNKVKDFLHLYTDTPVFRVNADIEGARYVKGFWASMYMLAEEFNAFSEPATSPICYDKNDRLSTLRMSLLFKSEQRAMEFSTRLRNWKFNHPMLGSSLEEIQVDNLPARVLLRGDLSLIKLNDYDPTEADDLPCTSLADFKGLASVLTTEPIQMTEPLSKYQSIESEGCFALRNPYKLHIKDKANFKTLREDENNMLAGSWNFHQLFDGLHTTEGHLVPSLGIEWVEHADNPTKMDYGKMRYRVTLRIHFFSNLAENDVEGRVIRRGRREMAYSRVCEEA